MSELALQLIKENKRTKDTFLDLGNCGLGNELPKELLECVWLEGLNLGSLYFAHEQNILTTSKNHYPKNILKGQELDILKNLTQLKYLDIYDNKIQDISFLENLTELQHLNLINNEIQDYSFLENLTELHTLYLSSNKIQDISILENLTELHTLHLNNNQIQDISFLKKLTQLHTLSLSNNKIRDYSFLENFIQLHTLYLSDNQIEDISFLQKLTQLRLLNTSSNNIEDASFLKSLTQLKDLSLYNNLIEDISFLRNLTELESLDLSNNKINNISILNVLSKLTHLEIDNNPFQTKYNLNLQILVNHWDTIKNILDREKEETYPIQFPVKIILLGNHASGKSSLLHFLLNANLNYQGKSTHILNIKYYPNEDSKPKAIFYDFGGQDYYHGIYRAFLSIGAIYFLLWDKDNNENKKLPDKDKIPTQHFSLNYWLAQKNYHMPDSKDSIFILQTHAQENNKPEYPNIPSNQLVDNLFYVSLHNDFNPPRNLKALSYLQSCLDELIETIQKERERKEPKWYIDFYEYILSKQGEDSTTLQELLPKYTPQGKNEADRLESLRVELEQFHNQGLVLYYKNINKDKVWLNPANLVSHIHTKILKKNLLTKANGTLLKKDFGQIDGEILQLLKEQKVIFEHESREYIIPNFLPLVQHNKSDYDLFTFGLINPSFTLRFKDFLPMGLINQLICFFGRQPDHKKFWRDQLLFTFEGKHKILINLDFDSLEIKVYISSIAIINKAEKEQITHYLFYVIMAMYWDFKPVEYSQLPNAKLELIDLLELQTEHEQYNNLFYNERFLPKDLYISIDTENWVKYTDLSKLEESKRVIISYSREDQEIKAGKQIPVKPFEVFTNKRFGSMKKIFVSYSKFDEEYKNELQEHLISLKREKFVEVFDDRQLELGSKWDEVLKQKIDECDYFLCLVSRSFLNVPYIYEVEMPRAHIAGKTIIPIIIKPCDWEHTPINDYNDTTENTTRLGQINAPNKAKILGLNTHHDTQKSQIDPMGFTEIARDAMWLEVVKQIRELIKRDN